ncbi:MAG: GntR family transcriptional regulator, partial [Betaproteobacteria bacterium]|nr:GntR family transcriptional regulator [Betaproteobacteria bacterium]
MTPSLQRGHGAAPLHVQLAQRLQRDIRNLFIAPGARLESVRACARRHGLNPQTVVAAYDLLQAQGLIEARPRQGFFARAAAAAATPARLATHDPDPPPPPTDVTALMRGMFAHLHEAAATAAAPGSGTLPSDWLLTPPLARTLRQLLRDEPFAQATSAYGHPAGDPLLRSTLA